MNRLMCPPLIAIPAALLLGSMASAAEPPVMPHGEAACATASEACENSGNCPAMRHGLAGWSDAGGHWMARMEDLGLTAEQRQAMQAIAGRFRDRGIDLAQQGAGIRDAMLAVAPDEPGYADATRAAAEDAGRIAAQMVELASAMRAEVHAVLTPEQRQIARERAAAGRQRWDDWRQRHRPPG